MLSSSYSGSQPGAADCLSVSPHPPQIPAIWDPSVVCSRAVSFYIELKTPQRPCCEKAEVKKDPHSMG